MKMKQKIKLLQQKLKNEIFNGVRKGIKYFKNKKPSDYEKWLPYRKPFLWSVI